MIPALIFFLLAVYAFVLDSFSDNLSGESFGLDVAMSASTIRQFTESLTPGSIDRLILELAITNQEHIVPYLNALLDLPAFSTFAGLSVLLLVLTRITRWQSNTVRISMGLSLKKSGKKSKKGAAQKLQAGSTSSRRGASTGTRTSTGTRGATADANNDGPDIRAVVRNRLGSHGFSGRNSPQII